MLHYSYFMLHKIGGHVSASGGYLKIFERTKAIGGNCLQMFVSSPRQWKVPPVDQTIAKQFKQQLTQNNLTPSFVHIKYLVNLSSPNPETVQKSIPTLVNELTIASALGLQGGMFHIGALAGNAREKGIQQVVEHSQTILKQIPDDVEFILENSASHNKIGGTLEEVALMVEKINHPQVKVCLDTAHLFAAGYDLRDEETIDTLVNQIDKIIGLKLLSVIHANDSKADFDSGRDLHENIGEGKIGKKGFQALLNHPKLKDTPFILEVPGFKKQGPDKKNIDILKSFTK